MMDVGRNAPCPCGSGLKYKDCCAGKNRGGNAKWALALVALGVLGLGLALGAALLGPGDGGAPAGKVWSEEHGHWHDAP